MPHTRDGAVPPSSRTGLVLRVVGAAALACSGYLHLRIGLGRPPLFADGQVTLSGLFLAQAAASALVVVWVLVRPSLISWSAFGTVAAASLAAVVLSTYVRVPAVGPFPELYEPVWYLDKSLSAGAAAVATAVAVAALLALRRRIGHD